LPDGVAAGAEVGDTAAFAGGFAVAFTHQTKSDWAVSVAFVSTDGARADQVVDLPGSADADAPRMVARDHDLLVARRMLSDKSAQRAPLDIESVDAQGTVKRLATVTEGGGALGTDSFDLATDGKGALLVRVNAVGPDVAEALAVSEVGHVGPVHALSGSDVDAEELRAFSTGSGYGVAWLAQRFEDTGASDAAEVPGQPRSTAWLQYVETDAAGNAHGPVRDLSPRDGHAVAYDARVSGTGIGFVVLDEGEGAEGSGGSIFRIAVRAGGAVEPPQRLPIDGVGHGAPVLAGASAPWLFWVGRDEQMRAMPLDTALASSGPASVEEAFGDARPLRAIGTARPGAVAWLAAAIGDPGPLRVVDCSAGR
jgi:hypothetical protein